MVFLLVVNKSRGASMKKIFVLLFALFVHAAFADTINLQWLAADNTTFQNSTCTTGGDLNVPSTTPTKYGYDFVGWRARAARELEYVTFQANAYIDTGIKFDSNEIQYETKEAGLGAYRVVFGAEGTCSGTTGFTNSAGSLASVGNNSNRRFTAGSRFVNTADSTNPNTFSLYINKTTGGIVATVGETVLNSTVTGTITTDKNIRIGQVTDNAGNCGFSGGNVYYFKITKDGVLVRDMIPALDADGVACFYDRVTKAFFYVHGSDLIAGPLKE